MDKTSCEDNGRIYRTVGLLIHTNRLHKKVIDRHVNEVGMHSAQHRMLMHLAQHERVSSQKELAEHFEVSTAAVAIILKKLEADGYITKEKNKNICDSRYNEVTVTEKGRNAVLATCEFFERIDSEMFKNISESELDALTSTLEKIRGNLEAIQLETDY